MSPYAMNVNPYLAPKEKCERRFRCSTLTRLFLRLIAGKTREPRFSAATGEYQLFQVGTYGVVRTACFLSPLSLLLPLLFPDLISDIRLWVVFVVFAEGYAVLLWFLGESVYFNEDHVRRFGPFRRNVRLLWSEVTALSVRHDGLLVLNGSDGRRIIVHNDLHGQRRLLETLRRTLPQEITDPVESDLAELEKLVA